MSGTMRSIDGAAFFHRSSTLSVGPPLEYEPGGPGLKGSRRATFTYSGRLYSAFPAFATCSTKLAMYHAWKNSSASLPNTCDQLPDLPVEPRAAAGTGCSNTFC